MICGDLKDLPRTAYDKILRDNAFNIAKNPKYDGCQFRFDSMTFKFFDKKSASTSGIAIKSAITLNQQLREELHKTFIRKFRKHKVYSSFKDNIWGADLADI